MKISQSAALSAHLEKELSQLGELLARLRHARKIKQADAALCAGISRNTAYRLEKGDPGLAIGQIFRYLEAIAPGSTFMILLMESDPSLHVLQAHELTKRVREIKTKELDELNF